MKEHLKFWYYAFSKSGKLLGMIAIILLFSFGGCKKATPPPASIGVFLAMPTLTNGSSFPSPLMDRIEIWVTGINGYVWPGPTGFDHLFGSYSYDCTPTIGNFCPLLAQVSRLVPIIMQPSGLSCEADY